MIKSVVFLLGVFLFVSCSQHRPQKLVQVSTIDALLQGVYDGNTSLQTLGKYGDFGIGTFNGLDGEMILLDGHFYQIKADGKIYHPESDVQTPFASVTNFEPGKEYPLNKLSYSGLKATIDSLAPSPNLFYAIKLKGTFEKVKTRSVPMQRKPYPPLVEVTENQPEFETVNVSGTLVGFYCPPYVTGLNVPGYHLHFLSDDKNFGGHLLAFELKSGQLQIDQINEFSLKIPTEGHFLKTSLDEDLSEELQKAEGE
ncbi:acetolactate decarboxylase [Maribellus luteus]|uniref:Alpha-acetolactate decarboxylase n=1 Tax=Maribellus luteus TaxID=2305463 RepID=A0A399SY89_9BACT|nr:acetolactate decarboxylase [Maribellus luteus]RIJ47017.1 acetolactate decarboxylase [Maribellus luteus]